MRKSRIDLSKKAQKNGKIILNDGSEIILKDFLGFAEKVFNKW
jgi:hypothetical protein